MEAFSWNLFSFLIYYIRKLAKLLGLKFCVLVVFSCLKLTCLIGLSEFCTLLLKFLLELFFSTNFNIFFLGFIFAL
jgi:hypothetical protein